MGLDHLQEKIHEFNRARDWEQFHNPRSLVLALSGEVGEVAALVQWLPDDAVLAWLEGRSNRAKFESELADVFSYLLQLASLTHVDLEWALERKIEENGERYPVDLSRGSTAKYDEL